MLKKPAIFTIGIFLSFLVFGQLCGWAIAQSGRPIPTPDKTPEAAPSENSKNETPICEESVNETEFIDRTERDDFIKRINRYGSCGYRLEKIARYTMYGDGEFNL